MLLNQELSEGTNFKFAPKYFQLLHCFDRLMKLRITVDHIKSTGIGLTLNGLRKCEGEVGSAASALVTKWKTIVAEEFLEGDSDENRDQPYQPCDNVSQKNRGMKESEKSDRSQGPDLSLKPQSPIEPIIKQSSDQKNKNHRKSIDSSTQPKPQPCVAIQPSSSKHSRTDDSSDYHKSNRPPKRRKTSTSSVEIVIDSSMGASFADALGIISRPSVLKKKPQLLAKLSKTSSESKNKHKSSRKDISLAPLLMKKGDRLEPLPDISSEMLLHMPSASKTHRSSPVNTPPVPKQRQSSLEESISPNFKSKWGHTKVFSGTKSYRRGEVPKLYDLCIRWLQEHIDGESKERLYFTEKLFLSQGIANRFRLRSKKKKNLQKKKNFNQKCFLL